MKQHQPHPTIKLFNNDCLNHLKLMPDNHVDMVLTDPPYYQYKAENWDNQWSNEAEFLAWLDEILLECWRVLNPNGSLYLFCGTKLAAETELLIKGRFNVLNHIVWTKTSGIWNRSKKESLRSFFPASERIIFAEHYQSNGYAKGSTGYISKCQDLKADTFKPLIDYFKNAREACGVSAKEINQATDTQMCSHWFSASQWKLPTQEQYEKLQALFAHKGQVLSREYVELHQEYNQLLKTYNELKQEYEHLKRPFGVTKDVPFTDVWEYASVPYYKGKHSCEKPENLLFHIISTSSREGQLILDPFMGSGSTGKVAYKLNRHFVGVELEEERYIQTCDEFDSLVGI